MLKFAILAVTTVLVSAHAVAFPLTSKNWGQEPVQDSSQHWMMKKTNQPTKVSPTYSEGFAFEGIIALSNCSGSLVKFRNTKDDARALMLTNGHCVSKGIFGGMMQPGEVIVNEKASMRVSLLDKAGKGIMPLTTTRILYATMTTTDVALYELSSTYADITKQTGVKALVIADTAPAMAQEIQIPSGYWRRTYTCNSDIVIPELREGGYVFKKSIRYSEPGCETIGGTSGSPIVSSSTGEVVGINNTGNEDGEKCTMNNPCEVDDNGQIAVRKGRSYGQQTYWFYGCLSADQHQIDLTLPTCELAKP